MFEPLIIPSPEFAETDLAVPEFDPYAAITELEAEVKRLRKVLERLEGTIRGKMRLEAMADGEDPDDIMDYIYKTSSSLYHAVKSARAALEPTP